MPLQDTVIGYYSKENSSLEIDFLVQYRSRLFPIEVKAEENVKSKSLYQFINVDHKDDNLKGYRLSMKGFQTQDWLNNYPLPAVSLLFS